MQLLSASKKANKFSQAKYKPSQINSFNILLIIKKTPTSSVISLERVIGIEPTQPAWKAGALPLSYTRIIFKKIVTAPKS
jgi:hypothetical protein